MSVNMYFKVVNLTCIQMLTVIEPIFNYATRGFLFVSNEFFASFVNDTQKMFLNILCGRLTSRKTGLQKKEFFATIRK